MKKMKNVSIGFLMFFNILCYSQEQCNEMIVTNDDVTEKTSISSDYIHIGNLSIGVIAGKTKSTFTQLIFKTEEGCVDDLAPIYIIFENGEKIMWRNYKFKFNCEGFSGFPIGNKKNENLLRNETIKTIRIDTSKSFTQVDLTNEQAATLKKNLQCSYDRQSWEEKIKYKR